MQRSGLFQQDAEAEGITAESCHANYLNKDILIATKRSEDSCSLVVPLLCD